MRRCRYALGSRLVEAAAAGALDTAAALQAVVTVAVTLLVEVKVLEKKKNVSSSFILFFS